MDKIDLYQLQKDLYDVVSFVHKHDELFIEEILTDKNMMVTPITEMLGFYMSGSNCIAVCEHIGGVEHSNIYVATIEVIDWIEDTLESQTFTPFKDTKGGVR